MEVAAGPARRPGTSYDERQDRQSLCVRIAEDLDAWFAGPRIDRPAQQRVLRLSDQRHADGLLELEDEPGADRADDVRRPTLLAQHRVVEVDVLLRVDIRD